MNDVMKAGDEYAPLGDEKTERVVRRWGDLRKQAASPDIDAVLIGEGWRAKVMWRSNKPGRKLGYSPKKTNARKIAKK